MPTSSPFLSKIKNFMLVRRYSRRTVDSYLYWIKYFILFHQKKHPDQMGPVEVEAFLTFPLLNVMYLQPLKLLR